MTNPWPMIPDVESMDVENYLASEPDSPVRREFVVCRAWRYPDSTVQHSQLVARVGAVLSEPAEAAGYWVVAVNMRLRVAPDVFYYPDVMVSCEDAPNDAEHLTSPHIVVEVVEQETETTDRREKLVAYQHMPSVRGYLIVDATEARIDAWWRAADDTWGRASFERNDWLPLPPLNAEISVARCFKGIA